MTAYLSIGANRIQTWLLRTPELALIRGASRALAEVTSRTEIEAILTSDQGLFDGVTSIAATPGGDGETGDVDGVVPLKLPSTEVARTIAYGVLTRLGKQLPGVEWEAWWCEANSYVAALHRNTQGQVEGRLMWVPTIQDCGLVEACEQCRREPARAVTLTAEGRSDPGRDCAARMARSGQGKDWDRGARPQLEDIRGQWAQDFDTLARRGGLRKGGKKPLALGRKESRNHLATIVADGNSLGALFGLISNPPGGIDTSALAQSTSIAIDAACAGAVVAAANMVTDPEPEIAAVEPHFLGGDDIFASVPAGAAWRFAATLSASFAHMVSGLKAWIPSGASTQDGLRELANYKSDLEAAIDGISLGIGICFAHVSHPVYETHAEAERAMVAAKRKGKGSASWIGWVDLTADTSAPPFTVSAKQVIAELDGTEPANCLPDVFALSASARAQLGSILRDSDPGEAVIQSWASRVGWERPGQRTPLVEMPAALSRARWFPGVKEDE